MSRAAAVLLLALLLGGGALGVIKLRKSRRHLNPSPPTGVVEQLLTLERKERDLDQGVWAGEVAAETYGDVLAAFWDALRTQDNPFSVLTNFAALPVTLPWIEQWSEVEGGVEVAGFASNKRVLDQAQWQELWLRSEAEGLVLAQSEFRHVRFVLAGAQSGPRSHVSFALHFQNHTREERWIIRGLAEVEWSVGGEEIHPASLQVHELEMLRRAGAPAFRQVMSQTFRPGQYQAFIDPLIAYDLDGDGLSEIMLGCANVLYRNRGKGTFEAMPLLRFPSAEINTALVADVDGDGTADFLAADKEGLLLYRGTRDGTFPDRPIRAWSAPSLLLNAFVMACADIDGDGDLDLWLAQYKIPYAAGQMPTPFYDANDGFPSYLLLNDGKGSFHDATAQSGLAAKRFRRTYSTSFLDLNGDAKADLVVVSDFAGMDLYLNDGGGHFREVTPLLGERHAFGMSHTFGDFNSDGALDIFMVGMNAPAGERLDWLQAERPGFPEYRSKRRSMIHGNRLFLFKKGEFEQTDFSKGVARAGWAWGAAAFDLDNDGDLDLYITNGHKSRRSAKDYESQFWRHDIYVGTSEHSPAADLYFRGTAARSYGEGHSYGGYEKNRLFRNEGSREWLEMGFLAGMSHELDCRNIVAQDLDGDGKVDLVFTTYEEWPEPRQSIYMFQNQLPNEGNWIAFDLRDGSRGFTAIGAKVSVLGGVRQVRNIVTGDSYRAQQGSTVHFGLGLAGTVRSAEILWPNGNRQIMENPEVNRIHVISPNPPQPILR